MKTSNFFRIFAGSIILFFAVTVFAQSPRVKINFESTPQIKMQIPPSIRVGNRLLIKVPKEYAPSVLGNGSISVAQELEGSNFVFSITIPPKMISQVNASAQGFEISLIPETISAPKPTIVAAGGTSKIEQLSVTSSPAIGRNKLTPNPNVRQDSLIEAGLSKAPTDYSVPESPGFTVLGLNPQTVVRPTTPQELATTILSGVDKNGNFQSGIALDTAPFMMLLGRNLRITNYRDNYLRRLLARTQVSFATVKGTSENDKSARLGFGTNIILFDNGDPRMDREIDGCFEDSAKVADDGEPIPPLQSEELRKAIIAGRESKFRQGVIACRNAARQRLWGRSSLGVGLAGSWISKNGKTRDFSWDGGAIWTSLVYGFEKTSLNQRAQLIFHFRRRIKEQVPNPDVNGEFLQKDSNFFGSRFRFGNPNFIGNFETVYIQEKEVRQPVDTYYRVSFGVERRLTTNFYLNLGIGGETKKKDDSNERLFVSTGFNWGVTKEPITP